MTGGQNVLTPPNVHKHRFPCNTTYSTASVKIK